MNNAAFVAFLGLPDRLENGAVARWCAALQEREGLMPMVERRGLRIFGAPRADHVALGHSEGLVWGHLFDREIGGRIASPGPRVLTHGSSEQLLERYWGGYVLIRATAGGLEVLRDPSGAVACYHCEFEGIHIVTSRPDLLFAHRLLKPEIDWTIVAQSLAFSDLRPAATALRGVAELLPGMLARLEGDRFVTRCAWSPWRFAADGQIMDRAAAIASLRKTARMTLGAWGKCFQRPMLEISGGLDSSIVAAGLQVRNAAHCLTFGPAPGDPDERPYARAVAAHLGFALNELVPDLGLIDVTHSDASHLPRPCARAFSQALDRPIQTFAAGRGIDAFIGGGGGDNVFCHLQSALPVLDRLEQEGLGCGMFRTATAIARQSRTNVWQVLAVAAQRWTHRHSTLPRPKSNRFLHPAIVNALPWPVGNPWLEAPAEVAPGKKRHAWSLIGIQNHLEGFGRETIAPHFSPLLSQPILEVCLAIPSWLWCEGGNNRSIAREAFRDLLPPAIIDRRTKGGFDTFVVQMIEANLPVIRTMLIGGSLTRQGLLDQKAIASFLRGKLNENEGVADLLALIDAEAWISGWERRSI